MQVCNPVYTHDICSVISDCTVMALAISYVDELTHNFMRISLSQDSNPQKYRSLYETKEKEQFFNISILIYESEYNCLDQYVINLIWGVCILLRV
jgi:hypothetical protein